MSDSQESSFELSIGVLEPDNLEELRDGYRRAFDEDGIESEQVSRYFFQMLRQEEPSEEEIIEFIQDFGRDINDDFLKGIYDGVIDYSEEQEYLPLGIT